MYVLSLEVPGKEQYMFAVVWWEMVTLNEYDNCMLRYQGDIFHSSQDGYNLAEVWKSAGGLFHWIDSKDVDTSGPFTYRKYLPYTILKECMGD